MEPTSTQLEKDATTPPAAVKKPKKVLPSSLVRRSPRKKQEANQRCKLMDICGKQRVAAEGHWASNDPEHKVHFVSLGPNVVKVWVYVVKVTYATILRSCSEIKYMAYALGTTIAWPQDKVIIY